MYSNKQTMRTLASLDSVVLQPESITAVEYIGQPLSLQSIAVYSACGHITIDMIVLTVKKLQCYYTTQIINFLIFKER